MSAVGTIFTMGVGMAGDMIVANADATGRKTMTANLARMSAKNQQELEELLQSTKSQNERIRILYEALGMQKEYDAKIKADKKRKAGIAILGLGVCILAAVIIIARKNG